MAAGDNSALGTLALVDKVGQSPGDPVFINRITILGDADYATGGTTGLLAEFRSQTKSQRTILAAICTSQRLAADDSVLTTKYDVTYDVENDAIQLWIADDADLDDEVAAGAGGTLAARKFEFLVFSK